MKKVQKILALLITLAMVLSMVPVVLVSAAENIDITTDKATYTVGESIMVTVTGTLGSTTDWVGIAPEGATSSWYYYYLTDADIGNPVDINAKYKSYWSADIPAGKYKVYFVPNNGYATSMTDWAEIEVVEAPAADGWNGTDTEAPTGEGTEASPYLIEKAAHLAWMSAQIGDGTQPTAVSDPFDGKYFKQTADIDLNGKTLNSIGYYFASKTAYAAFGGHYDGQGYRIMNGTVCSPNTAHEFSTAWGSGLFGAIYGATVNNVNLDAITATGISVVGTVVGIAAADPTDTPDASFNTIANCTVSDTCSVKATYVFTDSGKYNAAGRIGGIVGMAWSSTIQFCENKGAVNVLGNINYAGGIAGTVGLGATVSYCANHADIALDNQANANKSESAFGGIVGQISQSDPAGNAYNGDILIQNCYNTGCFTMNSETSAAISYGGILGAFITLKDGYSYVVENCYNLNDKNTLIGTAFVDWTTTPWGASSDVRVAGLVGCGYQAANVASEQLILRNSFSVEITEGACLSWYKSLEGSCNEYIVRTNKNTDGNIEIAAENVSTKSADEIGVLTAKIDAAIESGIAEETSILSTDKDVYLVGESIWVTAYGSAENKDWIGIQPKDDTGNSIYWYYITDATNGVPVDIKASGSTSTRPDANDYNLPAGDYVIYLVPNNGYAKDKTEVIEITITEHVAPAKRVYLEGEPVWVYGTGSAAAKDWIGIQPKDDTGYSIYWYYITDETNGVAVDIRTGSKSARPDTNDYNLPAGKYIVYFVPNNDYATAKTEIVEIEIVSKTDASKSLEAPISATYTLEDATNGMADGTISVTLSENNSATSILMYWADDNGPLEGYTALAKFKVTGTVTEHAMTPNTMIPQGATKLLVYTMKNSEISETYVEAALPTGTAGKDYGAPLIEFQVISDIHINVSDTDTYNKNFQKVLEDIATNSPNSTGIYINGDMANNGKAEEYANMWEIYNAVKANSTLPGLFLAVGNHDFYNAVSYKDGVNLFLENTYLPDGTHPDKIYYDFWKDGYHYIFLGTDVYPVSNVNAYLSQTQLNWLDEKLQESRNVNAPTFLFLHQSLYNTVAGSLEGQGWNGATPEAGLRAVLEKYPEVIMFNGHSHWTLDSESTMYERSDELPTIFNTASTAYLWTSYNKASGEALTGSQGYYVRVYEDKVLVMGRDFSTGEWVSSAMFYVDYSDMEQYQPTDPGTTNPPDNTDTEPATDASTNEPGTNAPVDTDEGGCGSVIGMLPMGIITAVAFAVMSEKKKRNR